MENGHTVLVWKLEGKRLFGRPGHRWEDNINLDFKEVMREGADYICLAQDKNGWRAVVNTVLNFRFHKMRKFSDYVIDYQFLKKDVLQGVGYCSEKVTCNNDIGTWESPVEVCWN
jgi:hypothetical protein